MHKLCSLKEIPPGSIVEMPAQYSHHKGELALLLDIEQLEQEQVRVNFARPRGDGEFHYSILGGISQDLKIGVTEDRELKAQALGAFVSQKMRLGLLSLTLGCDPEMFLTHSDGTLFPAWEYLPSEEKARQAGPLTVPAYWDGAQAEIAPQASDCAETLQLRIRNGLKHVLGLAIKVDGGAKLTIQNVVQLPNEVLKNAKDEHIRFRCSRSYNIYGDFGEQPPDFREYAWRCTGGHIHLGFKRKFTAPGIESIVRGLDAVLGIAGVSLAAGIDNPERRRMYGRAGEFRVPAHGLEYRVLSNFWMCHPAITMLIFDLARAVVRFAETGLYNLCWIADEQKVQEIINNCDVEGARKMLQNNMATLLGIIKGAWNTDAKRPYSTVEAMQVAALKAVMKGIGSVIDDPFSIEKNWRLWDDMAWNRGEGTTWQSLVEMK